MVLRKRLGNLGSLISKRPASSQDDAPPDNVDTPEANVIRAIKHFCEQGDGNPGEEVLHLPTIVESAVASPKAAEAACHQIRKFLSKDYYKRSNIQYNAVMLIRILADNPGQSFTKHMDKQFADTVKHLLRDGQDPSVAQILRESLESMDREKAYDTNLTALFAMWRKEKGLMANAQKHHGPRTFHVPAWNGQQQQMNYHQSSGGSHSRTLPAPQELAGRIEEARTSAKLLLQLVQSTPPHELLANDLVKEFSERCVQAQRSIQGYISCDSPPPDDDTMLTLIETNEQLSLAASKHQRAVLQARKFLGSSPSPPVLTGNNNSYMPGPGPSNSYAPPAAAAPNTFNPPAHAPSTSYTPPPQLPPRHEAPMLPPVNVGASNASPPRATYAPDASYNSALPPPPMLQAGGNQQPASSIVPVHDDPFADHHSPGYPGVSQPQMRRVGDDNMQPNGHDRLGSPESYHPGFQTTPSYLNRQESSANNLTMHGASMSPVQEANDQGHTTGNHRNSEVSPVAPVTYRY